MTQPPPPSEPSSPAVAAQRTAMAPVGNGPPDPLTAFPASRPRVLWVVTALAGVLAVIGLGLAWKADQRVRSVEQTLVKRHQETAGQASEARLLAKQAQEGALDVAAKVALLEARLAEVAIQRSQLEELMQSLSRSRDENLVVDIEAAIRVAVQQAAITGSAEPLVAALRQAEERVARFNQPRLEGVRRALARDLDRVKAARVSDIAALSLRLDEAVRMVDELPMLASPARRGRPDAEPDAAAVQGMADAAAEARATETQTGPAPSGAASGPSGSGAWSSDLGDMVQRLLARVWEEAKSLIRVTRIENPDAALMSPEQAFFVRENLKLRLLNARIALLSRQYDAVQHDLGVVQRSIARYFDGSARRTVIAAELVRQVSEQARQGGVPRPDETLAALAAAEAGR